MYGNLIADLYDSDNENSFDLDEQTDYLSDSNEYVSDEEKDWETKCTHESKEINGKEETCLDCGKLIRMINIKPKSTKQNNITRNIEKDLHSLDIPENIKDKANEFYSTIVDNNIHRLSPRKELIVFCVYKACNHYGFSVNYKNISKQLGYTVGSMSKIIKRYMNKNIGNNVSSPIDFVPEELTKLSKLYTFPEDAISEITQIYDIVKGKTRGIESTGHSCMCTGLIYFYMKEVLEFDIKISKYCETSSSSATTIQRIHSEIMSVMMESVK